MGCFSLARQRVPRFYHTLEIGQTGSIAAEIPADDALIHHGEESFLRAGVDVEPIGDLLREERLDGLDELLGQARDVEEVDGSEPLRVGVGEDLGDLAQDHRHLDDVRESELPEIRDGDQTRQSVLLVQEHRVQEHEDPLRVLRPVQLARVGPVPDDKFIPNF